MMKYYQGYEKVGIMKKVFFIFTILGFVFIYKSEFLLFNFLERIDNATNHTFKLVGVRNKFLHMVNSVNPFVGKIGLDNFDEIPIINIQLNNKNIYKLSRNLDLIELDNAKTGTKYIYGNLNEYSKIKLFVGKEKFNAKIKFHGTATGHIDHKKKSFRIKMSKKKYFENSRNFSFVIPEKLQPISFLFQYKVIEWFTGIKTTAKLVKLKINSINQGIYLFEEKISKELLEKNNLSGVDIVKLKNDWNRQYKQGDIFEVEPSYLNVKYNSNKDVGQLIAWEKIYETKNYNELKNYIDLDKFARNDALRALFYDYHGYVMNNQKLLYNTSNGRYFPLSRFESRLQPIEFDENSKLIFERGLSGLKNYKHTNKLLVTLSKNDDYRIKRNKYIYNLIQKKSKIVNMFTATYEKYMPVVLADNTNQAPGQQFDYIAKKQKRYLINNIRVLESYLSYNKVYTNLRKSTAGYDLEIIPDSNSPIKIKDINIGDIYPIEVGINNEKKLTIVSNKDELLAYLKDKSFIMGLDDSLRPKKNIYKFYIKTYKETEHFSIKFVNEITGKTIDSRDNYFSLIKKKSNFNNKMRNVPELDAFLNRHDTTFVKVDNKLLMSKGNYIFKKNKDETKHTTKHQAF